MGAREMGEGPTRTVEPPAGRIGGRDRRAGGRPGIGDATGAGPAARHRHRHRRWSPWAWAVAAATGLFVVVYGWLVLELHASYSTQTFDFGIFDQGLWLLSRFEEPFVTVRGLNLFGDHASLIMVPLAPLFWLWNDPGRCCCSPWPPSAPAGPWSTPSLAGSSSGPRWPPRWPRGSCSTRR